MRPVLHGDIVAVARVLYARPAGERGLVLKRLIQAADWADGFRRATGRMHPVWGDGSLMTVALAAKPPPEPRLDDVEYCGCMAMVFEALIRALSHQDLSPS
jgi:hypothetical protein